MNIEKVAEGFGWTSMGPQKMIHMKSWSKGKWRMNLYSTTNTLTIQDTTKRFDKGEAFKEVTNDDFLKFILQSY